MTRSRNRCHAMAASTVIAAVTLTGCNTTTDTGTATQPSSSRDQEPESGLSPIPPPEPRTPDRRPTGSRGDDVRETPQATAEETGMQIEITVGDETFTANVHNTPAGRDLLAQLPQTVEMSDHGSVEKTGRLAFPLSLDGQPPGADPAVGDLGYYAPGNDLVLYYGHQSYYDGIIVLGRLDDTATTRLAEIDGDLTVSVTKAS